MLAAIDSTLFMDAFNSDILYVDAPHIVSIEQHLLKRHQRTKVWKQKLMKWNLSLDSGNKMLMILWSPENSQAVDYTVLSALPVKIQAWGEMPVLLPATAENTADKSTVWKTKHSASL